MADAAETIVDRTKSPNDDASQEDTSNTSTSSSSSTSSSDDENVKPKDSGKLDVLSEDFDPLSALYCKDMAKIKNIVPSAPVLDNVEVFATRYYRKGGAQQVKGKSKAGVSGGNSSRVDPSKCQENVDPPQRMFTAEQMPIQGKMKEFSNVLKFMKKQSGKKG